mmetsp:Transcript_43284/g.63536  ORF Transcript_43284/g.63536 Transcript_43284/m.63536 type:complete len:141 (+) Transcript_43284:191-613(+)
MDDSHLQVAPEKKCIPCASLDSSAVLSRVELERKLRDHPLWTLKTVSQSEDIVGISRKFIAKNFQSALDCFQNVGDIAEREGHHPDLHLTGYREVEVVLFTHKLKGVTENDLLLAQMFDDEVEVNYSPNWLREHPEAKKS